MRRSHILACTVLVLVAAAVTLRARSHVNRTERLGGQAPPASASLPPEPADYVAQPWVAPGEADQGPARIVSMAPSITELVCALGMRDRLVGRTAYCRHPPGVNDVPEVGGLIDPNFERIKALGPDLVLVTANSSRVIAGLDELNMAYLAVPHNTLEEVYAAIVQIGDVCDRPRTARALVGAIWADIHALEDAARRQPGGQRPRRCLILLGELPVVPGAVFVAGPGSFLETFLQLAGHTNAARDVLRTSHGEIPLEALRRLDPDVILEFRGSATMTLGPTAAGFAQMWLPLDLRAITRRQVLTVGGPEWLSAGPRAAIALHRFISVLSGEDEGGQLIRPAAW